LPSKYGNSNIPSEKLERTQGLPNKCLRKETELNDRGACDVEQMVARIERLGLLPFLTWVASELRQEEDMHSLFLSKCRQGHLLY
jgi:hypothetical protein